MGPRGAGAEKRGRYEVGLEGQVGEEPKEEGELERYDSNSRTFTFLKRLWKKMCTVRMRWRW